jgi:hypothetical protein
MVLDNIKKKRGRSSFHGRRRTLSIFQLPKYLRYHLSFICRRRKRLNRKGNNNTEKGVCASSSKEELFFCEICTDMKAMKEVFCINGCSHAYCSDCVAMYIGSKLKDNIIDIRCPFPGCSGSLEADYCQSILPDEVFDRWGKASCEVLIDDSVKFYCPFADCSALLINDEKEAVIKAECPYCKRITTRNSGFSYESYLGNFRGNVFRRITDENFVGNHLPVKGGPIYTEKWGVAASEWLFLPRNHFVGKRRPHMQNNVEKRVCGSL